MSRKKTREELNQQLVDGNRLIRLIGEYINAHTKTTFMCEHNHQWSAKPNDVLNGHGCAICAGHHKTPTDINNILEASGRDVRLVGEYLGALVKTQFRCSNGHEWLAKPNSVLGTKNMRGTNCAVCSDTSLTKEIVNDRLYKANRPFRLIGDYVNTYTPVEFKCDVGHVWKTNAGTVMSGKTGCPTCADYGFRQSDVAYIYIIQYDDFLKYGVANNIDSRLSQHRRWGQYKMVLQRELSTGTLALQWERHIKRTLGGDYVDETTMGNGYTETLPLSAIDQLLILTEEFDFKTSTG